jgi:hypothetical protein
VRSSDITLTDVLLERNRGVLGGGIGASDTTDVVATVCRFNWNNATIGGGIYAAGENLNLDFNLFVGNSSVGTGGGALVSGFTTGSVAGNTFDRNAGGAACGGLAVSNSAIELFNNIVVNSTGHGIAISGAASPWIGYNHVWNSSGENYNGTVAGDGATTGDPAFADTSSMDYHLGAHSPSIDSGRPGVAWQDPDGSRGDQGWYGSHIFEMDQPAYPRDLTAALEAGDVVLRWTGNSEPDLGQYAVYSDITPDFKPSVSNFLGFTAAGDTSASFGAPPDSVWYVVAALDLDGYESGFSDRAFVGTATGVETARVYRNQLSQNVPNPFNPVTRIRYELGRTAHVTLSVYDVAGRMVRQLENGSVPPGIYTAVWDGTNENGAAVSSGIYFYRLQAGDFSHTRKMLLLK